MKKRLTVSLFLIEAMVTLAICLSSVFTAGATGVEYDYLSDLSETQAVAGWGSLSKDKGLDGKKINISDGKGGFSTFDKGLFIHASSTISYDISKKVYNEFEAYIGVNNSSDNGFPQSSSVTFEVQIDGKSVYKSGTFRIGTAAEHISVAIPAGAKKLTLITTDNGDGNTGDHSAWADAKINLGYYDPETVVGVELTADKTEASKGSNIKLTALGKRLGGSTFTPENLTFESADENIATVSDSGNVKLVGIGSIDITASFVSGGKTFSEKITVSSYDESFEKSWELKSPDGNIIVTLSQSKYGNLTYSVKKNGNTIVDEGSDIGISAEECLFFDGFSYVTESRRTIDEHYTTQSGKCSESYNHANEITLRFAKADYYFDVIFRAYDEGFAFRFTISPKSGTEQDSLTFTDETSSFVLPEKAGVYAIKVGNLTDSFNHEAGYSHFTAESSSGYIAFPILYETGDDYVLLTEAELYGDAYVGSITKGIGGREIQLQWAPKVTAKTVESPCPFTSPWRMGIVGGLDTIIESNLVEDVCTKTTDDFSWVEPGVTSWMWMTEGFAGQRDYATIKRYIDLASEFGWKYLILDEGWQPNSTSANGKKYDGYFAWFDEMLDYADSKGVGIIVWVLCADLDTPEEREVLKEWADKGIKGIKADFFDSEDAAHISYYRAIYEACAENKLIANMHGANKPSGERMEYPNIINREAVNGEEYGGLSVSAAVIWAYTRNVVGPMDITPRYYPSEGWTSSIGAQLAVNVLFESGIQCMGSNPESYYTGDAYLFYKNLPSAWDETRFVDGTVGTYAVIARRSGSDWYVGGMNSGSSKNLDVKLDFLSENEDYIAFVYADGNGRYLTDSRILSVGKGDTVSLRMLGNGGFAIRIVNKNDTNAISEIVAENKTLSMKSGESLKLNYTQSPASVTFTDLCWTSSDEGIAIVTRGCVSALRPGNVTITAKSYFDDAVKVEYNITVTKEGAALKDGWKITNPMALTDFTLSINENGSVIMQTIPGDMAGNAKNILSIAAPEGDFTVVLQLGGSFSDVNQFAGLTLFSESKPGNAVSFIKTYCDPTGNNPSGAEWPKGRYYMFYSATSGSGYMRVPESDLLPINIVFLKIEVVNGVAKSYYSYDSKAWNEISSSMSLKTVRSGDDMRIGLVAGSGDGAGLAKSTFYKLSLNGENVDIAVPASGQGTDTTAQPSETPKPTDALQTSETPAMTETPAESETPDVTAEPEEPKNNVLIMIIIIVLLVVAAVAVTFMVIKKKNGK